MSFNFSLSRSSGFAAGPVSGVYRLVDCCDDTALPSDAASEAAPGDAKGRARLQQLNPHVHCSIIGTCLSTAELRKLVTKLGGDIDAAHASDLEVHHEAVTLASDKLGGKALTKALDKRHEAAIQAFAKARDPVALAELWQQSLRSGAIPGAYWALMSHRHATPQLRQRAFGEVHMLSHLVGAANRADIRRLAALEQDNAELRERIENQQERITELLEEQQRMRLDIARSSAGAAPARPPSEDDVAQQLAVLRQELHAQVQLVALQAQRREAAEQALAGAVASHQQTQAELERAQQFNDELSRELRGAETHLQALADPAAGHAELLGGAIRGWRILYVGGRPSSTPAIRKLVSDSGAELVHHDGGLEDRKGLLANAIPGAHIVAFPVDCVDHDSATNLKRLCARHQVPFLPLRTASVTCFTAALAAAVADEAPARPAFRMCLRHG